MQIVESVTTEGVNRHERTLPSHLLWTNPEDVKGWDANGGPVLQEWP